jgi:hypothetical protein
MSHHDGVERRPAGSPFIFGAAWRLPCGLPHRIGFNRATARDELAQHRVIHPHTDEKPGPDHPTLRRVGAQWPRPHMGERALRALAGSDFRSTDCSEPAAGVGSMR